MIHSKGKIHFHSAVIGVAIIGCLLLKLLFFTTLWCESSTKFEPINTATQNYVYFRNHNEATNIVTIEL